jgi:hypothetical protein
MPQFPRWSTASAPLAAPRVSANEHAPAIGREIDLSQRAVTPIDPERLRKRGRTLGVDGIFVDAELRQRGVDLERRCERGRPGGTDPVAPEVEMGGGRGADGQGLREQRRARGADRVAREVELCQRGVASQRPRERDGTLVTDRVEFQREHSESTDGPERKRGGERGRAAGSDLIVRHAELCQFRAGTEGLRENAGIFRVERLVVQHTVGLELLGASANLRQRTFHTSAAKPRHFFFLSRLSVFFFFFFLPRPSFF